MIIVGLGRSRRRDGVLPKSMNKVEAGTSYNATMMGTHQPHNELFSYRVNLDKRVRADHPLR